MGGAWWQRMKTHPRAPKPGGGNDGSGTLQRENQNRVIPEAFCLRPVHPAKISVRCGNPYLRRQWGR